MNYSRLHYLQTNDEYLFRLDKELIFVIILKNTEFVFIDAKLFD